MTTNIIYTDSDSPEMLQAFNKARETFKYCWRELSWEARRIVPALDLAYAKVAFTQATGNPAKPLIEYMWVGEIGFDGDTITGVLINTPNVVTNINNGDEVAVPLTHLCDWLMASSDVPYGGFTIQVLRAAMDEDEREDHDEAWGIDFGDPANILVVRDQETRPENLEEHPMSINMKASLAEFLQKNPAETNNADEDGYTLLHRETVAGNRSSIEALLQAGADKNAKTNNGKTPLDFARQLHWQHLIPLLEQH